ncbi:MAG: ATP-binding protein [bacterium]
MRILVADDNKTNRYIYKKILSSNGYEVVCKQNGKEAVEEFNKQMPDLVILDVKMPLMDGYEGAEQIRLQKSALHVPILFISATYRDMTFKMKGVDIGGNDYITYPIDPEELLFKVKSLLKMKLLYDELLCVKRAKEESEQRFRSIYAESPIGIEIYDAEGRLIEVNNSCLDIFGVVHPEHLKKLSLFNNPSFPEESKEKLIRGEVMRFETLFDFKKAKEAGLYETTKSGFVYLQIIITPLGIKENIFPQGYLCLIQDITERRRIEEKHKEQLKKDKKGLELEVVKKLMELERTQKELEDAQRLADIGTLSASLAHELKNPLTAIRLATFNIKRKSKKNKSIDNHLTHIDKKIEECDQIIKNFLTYAKIKIPHYETISCLEILNECIRHMKHKYMKRNVKIIKNLKCGQDDIIEADPLHMKELFLNIFDNAFQALSDNKQGTIEIEGEYRREKNELYISIKDNGIGMNEGDIKNIFTPFFTNKTRGMGLGLTVCQQVVGLHAGTIDIQSKKGNGTTVSIILPIKRMKEQRISD